MQQMRFEEALNRYVDLSSRIRLLSAPEIESFRAADDYRDALVSGFSEIGHLSKEIKDLLSDNIYPLLDSDAPLTPAQTTALSVFSKALVNTTTMSYLDTVLCYRIANRLLADAEENQDVRLLIHALDKVVDASYIVMKLAFRLAPATDMGYVYKKNGLDAANKLLRYLDKKLFSSLPDDETKELVLVNARYINAVEYTDARMSTEDIEAMLLHLKQSIELEDDPYYVKAAPNYDWKRHRFRAYQYAISCTEKKNIVGMNKQQLERVYRAQQELEKLWRSDPETYAALCPRSTMDGYAARMSYLTGRTNALSYKKALRKIRENADPLDYNIHGIIANMHVLEEYLLVAKDDALTEEDEAFLQHAYQELCSYLYRMPKIGSITFATTILADILMDYVDVPGLSFTDFCLRLMVAIHPPTYVHTLTMSALTTCLVSHLAKQGRKDFQDLSPDYATSASLFHDIGKLFVIEFIMLYGRKLDEEEFRMIRKHSDIGGLVLRNHEASRDYSALAIAHHFRFDELEAKAAEGYFEKADIPYIAAATCADGLDAGTDTVGRSYKEGKPLETILEELRAGSGTLYAPYVVELFEDPEVVEDVSAILQTGREENYRKAYAALKELSRETAQG